MKLASHLILASLLLMLLAACGKDNKSGNSNRNQCSNGYTCSSLDMLNTDYNYNGTSVQTVIQQNPCITGSPARMQYQQTVNLPYIVQSRDIFVGVTSYGDVGMVVGRGSQTATFIGYLCQRQGTPMGPPSNVLLGVATLCRFKPVVAANLQFSDGSLALFRPLSPGGSSRGTPFSICR
jgi:hypothetical protein